MECHLPSSLYSEHVVTSYTSSPRTPLFKHMDHQSWVNSQKENQYRIKWEKSLHQKSKEFWQLLWARNCCLLNEDWIWLWNLHVEYYLLAAKTATFLFVYSDIRVWNCTQGPKHSYPWVNLPVKQNVIYNMIIAEEWEPLSYWTGSQLNKQFHRIILIISQEHDHSWLGSKVRGEYRRSC